MKKFSKILLSAALATTLFLPAIGAFTTQTTPAAAATAATGYDSADDVVYVKNGSYIYNWGAREEDCTFLSTYAVGFNSGNYSFENLSKNAGGTSQDDAPNSALYKALQSFMSTKHTNQTTYGDTRYLFCYTDCVSSNTAKISSFYSGALFDNAWDKGVTWNREHTWPESKGFEGKDADDIIMLRPTVTSENSSRGNSAYGESGGYYDPNDLGADLRGDCARIMLYSYVRWNLHSKMWGNGSTGYGVMESSQILLKWMKEDPVDTWEMGRNDAVEAITHTRNVFVDYPEYAWLLFGKAVPTDMVTPSGLAKSGTITGGTNTEPETPPTPETPTNKYTSIATLHASTTGTSATAKGVVTAVAKAGFTFNDGTGTMYFYTNKTVPTVKVGDEVEVSGTTSEFGGVKQFSYQSASYSKKDVDVPAYTAPTPTAWTGSNVDSFTNKVGEYVKVAASVSTSGNYINGTVSGASKNLISLVSPSNDVLGNIKLSSTAQEIVITGYTCYLSGGKYVYIIATSMQLASDVEEDTPVVPDEPTIPDTPDTPVVPDEPTIPETPETPDVPETPVDPPCDPPINPETPDDNTQTGNPSDVIKELLAGCNGSIASGLTALSLVIGATALLLKKKDE